jgi:signal transduction histidine kinase
MQGVSGGNFQAIRPESPAPCTPSGDALGIDFGLVFEGSGDLSVLLAPNPPEFTVLALSDAYLLALGAERAACMGRGLFELLSTSQPTGWSAITNLRSSLQQVCASMSPHSLSLRSGATRASGYQRVEEKSWVVRHAPLLAPDGRLAYVVERIEDVTELVRNTVLADQNSPRTEELKLQVTQLEAEIQGRIQDLERANALLCSAEQRAAEHERTMSQATDTASHAIRELESFSYSVAHDLRAPLRAIDGFSQALLIDHAETLNVEARHYLERVRAGTQRMSLLIDALLDLSRLHAAPLRRSVVDLSALASSILEELCTREPEREISIDVQAGLSARADPHLVSVLLQSLLRNAWKFTAKTQRARITVGCETSGGQSHWYVRDNGAGFNMAYAGRLFSAFQRMHKPSEFMGTGVGLAMVQRIVSRHGGRVWAEAEVGKGALFCFSLGPRQ